MESDRGLVKESVIAVAVLLSMSEHMIDEGITLDYAPSGFDSDTACCWMTYGAQIFTHRSTLVVATTLTVLASGTFPPFTSPSCAGGT